MAHLFKSLILTVFLVTISMTVQAGSARQPGAVLELFTSQGCSSCPPADSLMGEVTKNPDVLGLSYAVTYWDYIGWRDIFGSEENDARQTHYRDRLNARYVYTPQMVIAGSDHFVGSSKDRLRTNLLEYKDHARQIPLKWRINGKTLFIDLPDSNIKAVVWQVDIDHAKQVKIGRGENTGKTVTYHNVVRNTKQLVSWNGEKTTLSLDLDQLAHEGRDGCAILIQTDGYGPILAALVIDI